MSMLKNILKKDARVSQKSGINTVEGIPEGEYENKAKFYDFLMSRKLYNQIFWGNVPDNYRDFARESLSFKDKGIAADVGCGGLSFTHDVYSSYKKRPLILSDLSAAMLEIAGKRIPENSPVELLRADATDLPFRDNTLDTLMGFGFLHVIREPEKLLQEFFRVLKKDGDLHLSVLCADRNFSRKYLNMLYKKNLVSFCLHSNEIKSLVEESGFKAELKVLGSMAYLHCRKK